MAVQPLTTDRSIVRRLDIFFSVYSRFVMTVSIAKQYAMLGISIRHMLGIYCICSVS